MTKSEIRAQLSRGYWQVRDSERQVDLRIGQADVRINPVLFQPACCVYRVAQAGEIHEFDRIEQATNHIYRLTRTSVDATL